MASQFESLSSSTEGLARQIVDSAFKVHSALGPGLLESVYQACMAQEMRNRDIRFDEQLGVPIFYDRVRLEAGLRLDFFVEKDIVIELKAVEKMLPVHDAQLLTYLKMTGRRLGFPINFNVPRIKGGIKRIIL